MKANEYKVLEEAVDNGILVGWTRAHKHTEEPTGEDIRTAIFNAVMTEICEWFQFDRGSDVNQ